MGFAGAGQDGLDFDSGVWDFDGGNRKAVRGLHLGDRQGNSKKGGGISKYQFSTVSTNWNRHAEMKIFVAAAQKSVSCFSRGALSLYFFIFLCKLLLSMPMASASLEMFQSNSSSFFSK